ncbi:MAG: 30S ribosomal protein S15 [Planctomycetota bacterium]|nr:30S ribosomal protein S15 [Planctomycetota bacterium]MDI6786955.1 30S ribosomal protein S15 [Planctomycetota bacterium]
MALVVEVKKEVIKKYQVHTKDTGSTEVQIALLTERINSLSGHFQQNRKDYNSRRGLLKMIGHRSALLKYLAKYQPEKYQKLIKELNIRK